MATRADARRRWWGVFFLTTASGLLIWGQTVLKPILGVGLGFLIYWGVCFLFTGLAIFTALLDVRAIRRRVRDQHRQLIERTIAEVEDSEEKK